MVVGAPECSTRASSPPGTPPFSTEHPAPSASSSTSIVRRISAGIPRWEQPADCESVVFPRELRRIAQPRFLLLPVPVGPAVPDTPTAQQRKTIDQGASPAFPPRKKKAPQRG